MIINRGDRFNERWEVVKAIPSRSIGHQLYIVQDRSVSHSRRYALYKTVRLRDIPNPELKQRRVLSMEEERLLASKVQLGYLPEALDAFYLNDYPGIIYQRFGFGYSGGKLLRYDTSLNNLKTNRRNLSRVAGILRQCIIAAEELFNERYVHMNLTPDHIFLLPDDYIKIIGQSAICPVTEDGFVDPDTAARWKLSRGYHERETYWRDTISRNVKAHRARWSQFAALAIELLFGIDLGVYLHNNSLRVIHLGSQLPGHGRTVFDDLREHYCYLPLGQNQDLAGLINYLKTWTHRDTTHRVNALDSISAAKILHLLQRIENKDVYGTLKSNVLNGSMRRYPMTVGKGDEFDFVVTEDERLTLNDTNPSLFYVNHRGLAADDQYQDPQYQESRPWSLSIYHSRKDRITNNPTLLFPGDIVPVKVRDAARHFVELTDWAEVKVRLTDNLFVPHALNLGVVRRGKLVAHDMPWALLDYDGRVSALPIVSAKGEKHTFIPQEGQFFSGTIRVDDDEGITGIAPRPPFEISDLTGRRITVQIRSENVEQGMLYFDIVHEETRWTVTGAIHRSKIPNGERVSIGDEIPIIVRFPYCTGDWSKNQPLRGENYQVTVDHRNSEKMWVSFVKDGLTFNGIIFVGLLPWGTPEWQWQKGDQLLARVLRTNRDYITLEPLDRPPIYKNASDYFKQDEVCDGKVLRLSQSAALVGLAKLHGGITVGVKATIPIYRLNKSARYRKALVGDVLPFVITRIDDEAERVFLDIRA